MLSIDSKLEDRVIEPFHKLRPAQELAEAEARAFFMTSSLFVADSPRFAHQIHPNCHPTASKSLEDLGAKVSTPFPEEMHFEARANEGFR